MSHELAVIEPQETEITRPEQVLNEIMHIKGEVMVRVLRLGNLLLEAKKNSYCLQWGYGSLSTWIEQASGLDMSERDAYYHMRVVERSAELGIPDEDLVKVKFSKLKAIMSLTDEQASPDVVRELVKSAETDSLAVIRQAVNVAKKMDYVFRTIKHDRETDNNVILPAFERMRREYGDTIDTEGNPADITDSKIIEMMCAEFLASPEEQEYDIVDAEYTDEFSEAGEAS